jgi:hypothetical protein
MACLSRSWARGVFATLAPGDMPDVLARPLMSRFEENHAGCTLRELW